MAKSTGLFAGADSSLVAAASRAGQFMGPPDYSKTFQAVADSYDKTMQAQAEMWGNIAMSAATIGKEIKNNTDVEPPEGGEFAQEELERASDLYKQSYGLQKTDDELSDRSQDIVHHDFAYSLLKDDGVKTKIIKKYLPLINQQVNRYLQMMDFYINFKLNEEFIETVESPIHEDFSYSSFSREYAKS